MIRTLLFIGGGSFLGGIARYLVKVGCGKLFPAATLPLGTMVANVAGCFLIGLFLRNSLPPHHNVAGYADVPDRWFLRWLHHLLDIYE